MSSETNSSLRFKVVIPRLTLTILHDEVVENDYGSTKYELGLSGSYRVKSRLDTSNQNIRVDGLPTWSPVTFDLYPIVLCGDGSPWYEANLWILSTLQNKLSPNMRTFDCIASDLAAYRQFIEEYNIDWLQFPSHKQNRPIHRFNGRLKYLIQNQEVAASTAKRRIATVIRFYRWLVDENNFQPQYEPWKDSERYIQLKSDYGSQVYKKVKTTDLNLSSSKEHNPYDDFIDDGGKLRPLSVKQQEWLVDSLLKLGNTEITLIHIFGLVTGARIQSILTMRVRHFYAPKVDDVSNFVRIPIGLGTDVDSKNGKKITLWVPVWFYRILHTYVNSERAISRRKKAFGGEIKEQYLFLTKYGTPFYDASNTNFAEFRKIRHSKRGQAIRQYITDYILPYIHLNFDKHFHYTFHDLRATFGMNLLDELLQLAQNKEANLNDILEYIKVRMGHSSLTTTNRYLNFRKRTNLIRVAQSSWEDQLSVLADYALHSLND